MGGSLVKPVEISAYVIVYFFWLVDLDYILDTGDQIYMKTIHNKKKQGRFKNMLLTYALISTGFTREPPI
jgi:hypothetical protein